MRLIQKCDPRDVDSIELGKDDYLDYLYGCFRVDNPLAERFAAQRDALLIAVPQKKIHVAVPESLKIPLPENIKVTDSDLFQLVPINNDRDSMHLLTMRAGWNQNERDINRIIDFDPEGAFCAKLSGDGYEIPIGTCVVSPLGKKNTWIGMILVHPELRRQGLATEMMLHCITYAIDGGKVINGLDATPMGNTVYINVGYTGAFRIWRSVFETQEFSESKVARVQPITDEILNEIIRYDAACFMERENVLRALYEDADGNAWYYPDSQGNIAGYAFGRTGRIRGFVGPVMADSQDAAAGLIAATAATLHKQDVLEAFIDTPEIWFSNKGQYDPSVFDQANKPSGHCIIKSAKPVRDFLRMYQAVDYCGAHKLISDFANKYKLSPSDAKLVRFAETMEKAVANYTETAGFMEFEERVLQQKLWGTTGPEKG